MKTDGHAHYNTQLIYMYNDDVVHPRYFCCIAQIIWETLQRRYKSKVSQNKTTTMVFNIIA